MLKMLLGFSLLISFTSCQYVNNSVETLKNNVRQSLEIPDVSLPLGLHDKKESSEKSSTDSTSRFTISSFFKEKFKL